MNAGIRHMQASKSILIIEDDALLSSLIEVTLANENYDYLKSNTKIDSLNKLNEHKFDCVLLDLNLKDGDNGEDILERIQSEEEFLNFGTPIILMTGITDVERIDSVFKKVSEVLVKPFRVNDLVLKIKNVC